VTLKKKCDCDKIAKSRSPFDDSSLIELLDLLVSLLFDNCFQYDHRDIKSDCTGMFSVHISPVCSRHITSLFKAYNISSISIYLSELTSVSLLRWQTSGTVCYDILVVIAGLENNRLPNVQEIRRKSIHYPNYVTEIALDTLFPFI